MVIFYPAAAVPVEGRSEKPPPDGLSEKPPEGLSENPEARGRSLKPEGLSLKPLRLGLSRERERDLLIFK